MSLRYFHESEFTRLGCSLEDMDFSFMRRLDDARHIAGIPFVLNSAYRTKEYEISQGRKGTSAHCEGCAVDIRCASPSDRFKIVHALLDLGFNRIGIGKGFIHVDSSLSHKQNVIFDYYK